MRLLVHGATGRIGGAVVTEALDRGHAVTAVVRDPGRPVDRRAAVRVADILGDGDSAAACATPLVNCAPNEALAPVIGPATPSLTSAEALPAANASASARAAPLRNVDPMLTS